MRPFLLFPLLWVSGCCAAEEQVSGPESMTGHEGGSLTVRCRYDAYWKTHRKWWCRGEIWSSCEVLVLTQGSEQLVKKDRVSIRDNQTDLVFTVTMEHLSRSDEDVYWCGVEKTGVDLGFKVKVIIEPEPTMTPINFASTTTILTAPSFVKTDVSPKPTSPHSDDGPGILELRILLPVISAVLLLLLVASSLFAWQMMKQQRKVAETSPEQALQTLEDDDVCYMNLSLQQSCREMSVKPSAPNQANQVEVEYVCMATLPRQEISYAALSLDPSNQEPTYGNTGHLVTHIPRESHQEPVEYSSIRKL